MSGFLGGGIMGRGAGNDMRVTPYTGNGGTKSVTTGQDLSTGGLVLLKAFSGAGNCGVYDQARGGSLELRTNSATSEISTTNGVTAYGSSGFTLGALADFNTDTAAYRAFTWLEKALSLDIVKYEGNGANRTISHNLGVAPSMIWVKSSENGWDWVVYHAARGATRRLLLNSTAAEAVSSGAWNNTEPTSSVFSIGTDLNVNQSGMDYVAYLFAAKTGDAAFGSYVGTGTDDGVTLNLGFKPKAWLIRDTALNIWAFYWIEGGDQYRFGLDSSGAITNRGTADFELLGIQLKIASFTAEINAYAHTYIYAAWR